MNKLWWVIIGLVALIVGLILFDRDPEPVSTQKWKDVIANKNVEIEQLRKDSNELALKWQWDSAVQANDRQEYVATLEKKSREIARMKANPTVIEILHTHPSIDSLVKAQDSLIVIGWGRIDTLESNLADLRIDMAAMKTNFSGILQAERTKFEASQSMNKDLEKQVKKSKRGAKLAKILIPIGFVGGLFLGGL